MGWNPNTEWITAGLRFFVFVFVLRLDHSGAWLECSLNFFLEVRDLGSNLSCKDMNVTANGENGCNTSCVLFLELCTRYAPPRNVCVHTAHQGF